METHILYSVTFLGCGGGWNRAVYEIMWKNVLAPDRPLLTTWRMRFACCITRATNTHSECVILIAFPLQRWFHERTAVLRYSLYMLPLNCLNYCVVFCSVYRRVAPYGGAALLPDHSAARNTPWEFQPHTV